eukprot:GHRR01001448.1.p1 GENE.GHRR01001448.1~~GHRR01001448.1.p1  ORF type:complete len:185 (+),score=53.32 GHRR01001448.1:137-691(+)
MATSTFKAPVSGCFTLNRKSARPARSIVHRQRAAVVMRAFQDFEGTRRQTVAAGAAAALACFLQAAPAQAFLGFGEGPQREEAYKNETNDILGKVNTVLAIGKDDPSKEDRVKALRKEINTWVAKYRRDDKFAGRPSYGNTYSALNALAGHYNSFGATTPIPKKRLERLTKELNDAQLLLTRGR